MEDGSRLGSMRFSGEMREIEREGEEGRCWGCYPEKRGKINRLACPEPKDWCGEAGEFGLEFVLLDKGWMVC